MSNTDFDDEVAERFTRGGPGPEQQGWGHHPPFPGPPWGWGPSGSPQCGPWPPKCPPGPGWDWNWRPPLGAIRGPIIGVTDGSVALAGEVGEYIYNSQRFIIPAANSGVPQFAAMLVIPPGDWDCTLVAGAQTIFTGINALLDPVPPGIRIPGELAEVQFDFAPATINIVSGERTFALVNAQPQLITVQYHVQGITATSYDSNGVMGQIDIVIIVDARRRR